MFYLQAHLLLRAEDAADSSIVTASHDEHLRILLSRMYEFNSSWLPVLDAEGQFLGEVTQESIADYLSSGRSRGGRSTIVSPAEVAQAS